MAFYFKGSVSCCALAVAIVTLAPEAALAQSEGVETGASTGSEIIVTARRKEERLIDVPVAVTAITGEKLENYSVTAVGDIATFVPSMVVGRQVTGSSASIFLRGVGSSSLSAGFDQSVSFNIDGLPFSRGREIAFAQYDIASVEVLKGPQALYFGRNTTGGLISIRSNDPGNEFEGAFKAGYGFETRNKYAEAMVSGPLSESFGARLALRWNDSRGSLLNTGGPAIDPPTGLDRAPQAKYRDPTETISGRLTLKYEPNETLSFLLKAGYTHYEDDGAGNLYERKCGGGRTAPLATGGVLDTFADCNVDGRADHSASNPAFVENYRYTRADGTTFTDLDSYFGSLTTQIDTDVFDVTLISGYAKFKQTDYNDFVGSIRNVSVSQLADFEQYSQEVRIASDFDGPINFTVGGFYADSTFIFNTDSHNVNFGFDPVRRTWVSFSRDNGFDAKSFSLFGQAVWQIVPSLELAGGVRWSSDKRDSYQESLPGAATAAAGIFPQDVRFDDYFDDTDVSPEVTLSWKPTADTTIYAAYKQGYKSGGFNLSQTITAAASLRAGQYKSETAEGFEIGAHALLADRQLLLNAAVYDYKYSDLQVQFFDPISTGQIVANAGALTTKGFELDFNFQPNAARGLSFRGAYAYNEAKYKDFVGACYGGQTPADGCNLLPRNPAGDPSLFGTSANPFNGQLYTGRIAPKAPKHAWQLGGAYEAPIGEMTAGFSIDLNHSSSYNYTDVLIPEAVQKGFTRLDARIFLGGEDDRWQVALIGRNLTDEIVVTSANEFPFTGGSGTGTTAGIKSDMNTIVERPREVSLEVSFSF